MDKEEEERQIREARNLLQKAKQRNASLETVWNLAFSNRGYVLTELILTFARSETRGSSPPNQPST